ncbi:glycosyltransferase family 4 protein [Pararoseomonas indoligenes]|uniref:Glycosyltransferase family 1 protein n=1 Tax=Roseomonas indoligenes TaxID=2820811 RepID=A0A940MU27_9PROT|nr:glycosyltransferase family 1 protein [Pararoseomonas indoligenes]MBP0494148.1 glycosyltransferase family 1 protein [Pararoseomonas indoligenes]
MRSTTPAGAGFGALGRVSGTAPPVRKAGEAAQATANRHARGAEGVSGPASPARILIVTDAWRPQVNGVVRTLSTVVEHLRTRGDVVEVIGPERFPTVALPSYAEIRLALVRSGRFAGMVDAFAPSAIHIATEGPLGWAARRLCRRRNWPFTTSFHTRFPEYLHLRAHVPQALSWALLRRFHAPAAATLAATTSLLGELESRGFRHLRRWSRGVDLDRFPAAPRDPWPGLPRPVFLYAGRVAVEKNIEAFLSLDLPGSKVVVGDGPHRAALQARFPEARFTGYREGVPLAAAYAGADVFVFPSRTDTFGLVLLEALATGTPVAAFPVTGPLDVLGGATEPVGALDEDLRAACLAALGADRAACRRHAAKWSWAASATQLRDALAALPQG